MALKLVAIPWVLSAAVSLCAASDIVSSRSSSDDVIISPISANVTPTPYSFEVGSISADSGQKIVMLEFDRILRDAALPFSGIFWGFGLPNDAEILLALPDGVGIHDEPANYSSACSNASTIFSSTLIFRNCLQLGFTSVLLHAGLISIDHDSLEDSNSYFHFGDISTFDGPGVLHTITTCISATCQNTSTETCSQYVTGNLTDAYNPEYGATEQLSKLFLGLYAYCDGQYAQPNSDVLGPGVVIASFTQLVVMLFFFVVSKSLRWYRRVEGWYRKFRKFRARKDPNKTEPMLDFDANPTKERSRLVRALKQFFKAAESVFVDFHEAQIFFVLAIQIASLWFFNPEGVMANSKTYAEAVSTSYYAFHIASAVATSVFLGQSLLQRHGRHWWYTTILTLSVVIVAWVLDTKPTTIDYAAFWKKLIDENPISQCGGNPSPRTYCGVYSGNHIFATYALGGSVDPAIAYKYIIQVIYTPWFSLSVYQVYWAPVVLFTNQLFFSIRSRSWWSRLSRFGKRTFRWDTLSDVTRVRITRRFQLFICFIWAAEQTSILIYLVFALLNFRFLFNVLTPLAGGWSYGQLVASLSWAPLGLKLLYYTFCGIEKGIQNRVGERFLVQDKDNIGPYATLA